MNAADIPAWLASGQDFAQGAALYEQVGASSTFKHLFGLGPTDYSRRVLLRELSALVVAPTLAPAPAALAPPPASEPPPAAEAPLPSSEATDALLADLAKQLKAVRDERSHLHPQLTASGLRQPARLKLAGRIVGLTDKEVALLAAQAHVRAHGRLPGPVPLADITDREQLRRLLTNRRAQRSKLKDPARAADLARVQADIDLILQKLAS
jgi:hypothetical protein